MRHYLIFFVESIAELMVDNSLLGNLLSKDYGYVIHVSAYLGILLLLTFVPLGVTFTMVPERGKIYKPREIKQIHNILSESIYCLLSIIGFSDII